jgi:hypothetical protein
VFALRQLSVAAWRFGEDVQFLIAGTSSNINQPVAFGQDKYIGCEFLKTIWIDCRQVVENGTLFRREVRSSSSLGMAW